MTVHPFEYDAAISFAAEDRAVAEELADLLARMNRKVFRDEYRATHSDLWGKDTVDHLVNLYARKARFCLLLVSRHYPLRSWTRAERASARERALRDPEEYILLFQLDDGEVPGLATAKGYKDLRGGSVEELESWLAAKLKDTEVRSGPPPASHDLRSGNIPTNKPDGSTP